MPKAVPIEVEVTKELKARFFEKTRRSNNGTDEFPGCLIWTAAKKPGYDKRTRKNIFYGYFNIGYRRVYSHRFALYMELGFDPGPSVDHLCYNTLCVEPTHLRGGSIQENNLNRRVIKSEFCVNGHERNDQNVYWRTDGKRDCRACWKLRDKKRYPKKYARQKEQWTHDSSSGDFGHNPKLTPEQVSQMIAKYKAGTHSQRALAREYKISQPAVRYHLKKSK